MSFIPLDFPREVLDVGSSGDKGRRWLVNDWNELENYWKGRNGSGNVYFTAYGYRATKPPRNHRVDYETPIIRHFVMDFDCADFKQRGAEVDFSYMHEQAKRLHRYLIHENYRHFIWFSGGGFHFWIPLANTHMPSDGYSVSRVKEGGRNLITQWHKKLNLSCNDPTVAFDTSGMIRIPNSYNAKRGAWSIPLSSEEMLELTHDGLMELAQEARQGYIEIGEVDVEIKIPERKNHFTKTVEKVDGLPDVTLNDIIVLPCLAQSALGAGNPTHKARFHLASYLAARLRWFYPPESVSNEVKTEHVDRIVQIISEQGWVDFDDGVTQHQVETIVFGGDNKKGYCAATCATLEYDGLCVGRCRYYDGSIGDVDE